MSFPRILCLCIYISEGTQSIITLKEETQIKTFKIICMRLIHKYSTVFEVISIDKNN
jgi:hypothetical protein